MSTTRIVRTTAVAAIALVAAMPVGAQKEKGGGKPGGGAATARQVTIDDRESAQLRSDGKVRSAAGSLLLGPDLDGEDIDGDGTPDGDGIPDIPIIYVDHRIVLFDANMMPIGPYPDPCVGSNDNQFDLDRGADPNHTDCNIAAGLEGNGRTFTVVFIPDDPGNANDPVHSVCQEFRFLSETEPGPVWGSDFPDQWQTGFEWNDPSAPDYETKGCSVTPSAGAIITDPDSTQHTSNAQFYADPFADGAKQKGKKGGGGSGISLNINFRIDRRSPGESNQWQIRSQQANLLAVEPPDDPDVRIVTATDQLFDLCLGSSCIEGFKLPLQLVYRRYEVSGG